MTALSKKVDLVAWIHDEFGTDTTVIRTQILAGEVIIDGRRWEADKLLIPNSVLDDGRVVQVNGPDRRWRLTYRSDDK